MCGPRPAARLCNEKMALFWSRLAMVPSGWAESWPLPHLFEHGERNFSACERLRKIAAVFYLSFLLFCVVVVGFSCFPLWEMLGPVKEWFGDCKLPTQVVHVALDTPLAKSPPLVDDCTFWDRTWQGECCWWIKLPMNPLESLCARPAALQLQQLSRRPSLQWEACVYRDHDLTGCVDHAQCCTLHATAWWLYGRWAFERVEDRPVGERQWAWTVEKTRKTQLLSVKTQQRADTTRSRGDNKFLSHASGNTKPGWTSSFSPSSLGRRHACRRPNVFQWRLKEKVFGGTKSGCELSASSKWMWAFCFHLRVGKTSVCARELLFRKETVVFHDSQETKLMQNSWIAKT